ncbi:MAG: tRNA (adenosine(37)-N6)-dimethylallyltransferase MiaA [Pseudobdellovibrionaceae bacterium]
MVEEFKFNISIPHKFIFVQGPTATGKSDWALHWAQKYHGHIINCDSIQLYQGLKIGSAQPTEDELSLVPHHLYDYVQAPQEITAGIYCRDFWQRIDSFKTPQLFFVVGGTGFYFQALEKGMLPVAAVNVATMSKLEAEYDEDQDGPQKLYLELQVHDPVSAEKIHPADRYRLCRALEIIRSHGKTLSELKSNYLSQAKKFPFPLLKLSRQWGTDELRARITARVDQMIQKGLEEEVRRFAKFENWAPLASVGYKETVEYLQHRDKQRWRDEMVLHTVQLVKKQKTWFKRDKELVHLDHIDQALSLLDNFVQND